MNFFPKISRVKIHREITQLHELECFSLDDLIIFGQLKVIILRNNLLKRCTTHYYAGYSMEILEFPQD